MVSSYLDRNLAVLQVCTTHSCITGYVENLLTELWKIVEDESCTTQQREKSPPPLSSTFEQPVKEEAIIN